MSKKKTPRPKVQRCVGCDEAAPMAGARFCADCANEADEKMGKSYVTGEIAKLVWFAREWGIDVDALVVDAIEAKRSRLLAERFAEVGIEYTRGKPIPESMRRKLRDAAACRYLRFRQGNVRGCARMILADNPGIFESEDDVRQHARRMKRRDP